MERFQASRRAQKLAAELRCELPALSVDDRPAIVDGVWTLAVTLPPEINAAAFLAATVAENVPWLEDPASREGTVLLPFGFGYTPEQHEQLILVAAKVLYYFQRDEQGAALAE